MRDTNEYYIDINFGIFDRLLHLTYSDYSADDLVKVLDDIYVVHAYTGYTNFYDYGRAMISKYFSDAFIVVKTAYKNNKLKEMEFTYLVAELTRVWFTMYELLKSSDTSIFSNTNMARGKMTLSFIYTTCTELLEVGDIIRDMAGRLKDNYDSIKDCLYWLNISKLKDLITSCCCNDDFMNVILCAGINEAIYSDEEYKWRDRMIATYNQCNGFRGMFSNDEEDSQYDN